ncbi:MAG: chromosomal replication initiator protein DnaA [Bacteroidota bacterium]
MTKDYVQIWDNCLQTIRRNVPPHSYKTWFEPIRPVGLREHSLTIQVPNKFFYEWLEEHYVDMLKMTIRRELGETARLEYQILVQQPPENSLHTGSVKVKPEKQKYTPGSINADNIKNPFVIPGIRKLAVESNLNKTYTFDHFIEGDCNRLARNAGIAIAKKPGGTSFNPLVIFGDVGLGKTHLAHAIGNGVLERFNDKKVLYVTCDKFGNQIIQSIKNNAVNDFVNFYQQVDLLIVDDIQFLENKPKTQEIFFNIFNQLHQSGRQIILTSDRPPKDMKGIENRLISRFKWGLSADLQAPSFETRMAIFEHKMGQEGVELPPDVTEFICFNIKNNIRELEGVMVSLVAQSSLNERQIDIRLAKAVIKSFVKQINKEITIEFIQELVANYFDVSVDRLAGKTRKRQVVIARQLSMYLAKKMTNKSLKAIGDIFGGRDHSTVIYSCRTVQDLMETDVLYKDTVSELEQKIKTSLNEKLISLFCLNTCKV